MIARAGRRRDRARVVPVAVKTRAIGWVNLLAQGCALGCAVGWAMGGASIRPAFAVEAPPSPGPSAHVDAAAGTGTTAAAQAPNAAPAAAIDPDAPTVAARIDRATGGVHVGDPLTLTVTAVSRRGTPVNLPNVVDLAPFSLLAGFGAGAADGASTRSEAEKDLGDGHVRHEYTLKIAAYEPGDLVLPAIEVTYLGPGGDVRQARTQPIPIKIASLIANEPEPTLKDNLPPVTVWKRDLTLVTIAGGLLTAALGALITWLLVRKLRQRVVVRPGPPPRPAHEVALERLDRLGAYGFLENADNRPFYFAVSEVIRDYVGSRYGFDSLELTTDELMSELRRRASRSIALDEIERWLCACDLVKFAKVSPTANEARGALETAIRIVESTRQPPEPQGAATAPASASGDPRTRASA